MTYKVVPHAATGEPMVEMPEGQFGLGCLPKMQSVHAGDYPPVGATWPDIPQTAWTEQDLGPFGGPVLNQGQTSSCGPFSLVEAMMTAFQVVSDTRPVLSAWFAYGKIVHGQDKGTALPDLLALAQTVGVCLDSSVKQGDFSGTYPAEVMTEAARFKIEAAYDSPTWTNLCSVAERRQISVIGVDVGQQFTPDAGGFLPPYKQGPQILGHALSVVGKKFERGSWFLKVRNHWGNWGLGGYAYMPQTYVNVYFGAWALRTVGLDPLSETNPPPVA